MSSERTTLVWRILMIITLYLLQGFIQGFTASIPIYLASYKASWKQQGTFSLATYPFSFKILWAPIIDSIYIRRFGRPQTWLVPVQLIIGIILLIVSFYLQSLLINLQVTILTIIFFIIFLFIASQDIIVDGWAMTLFRLSNPQWTSTCQTIGEMSGRFFGSTILLILESPHFMNKYIRSPLSLPHRSHGLFTLQQFTMFWGIAFIVVSITIAIIFFFTNQSNKKNEVDTEETNLNLFETYLAIFKLFKKPCIRKFALVLLTFNVGFAATFYMTNLTLLGYGITRDTLALMSIPLLVVHIIVPLCLSGIQRPIIWFARGYIPRLIGSFALAAYIFFTPKIIFTPYFYPVLIIFLCLNEALVYVITVSRCGVYAKISDPRFAATYMTLLATISNLGQSISSTSVLYIANWLPKSHAYSIEVGVCIILGLIWISLIWRLMSRLDVIPIQDWYLKPSLSTPPSTTSSQPTLIEEGVSAM